MAPSTPHLRLEPATDASADDASLVAAMQTGNERALATLYDRHAPTLLGLVMRIVHQRADAEAVLMAAFLQAWESASGYDRSRGSVLAWLTMIVRSRAMDAARATARRGRHEEVVADDAVPIATAESRDRHDALDAITAGERRSAVERALATLQPAQRRAIELAFLEGKTHVEVAALLSEPLGTIKTRIRLGMTKLRELLTPLAMEDRA